MCTPAYVYLVISVIAILAMMLQNGGNNKHFCIGEYGCDVESKGAIFIGQGLYTAFWVFVLDSICKSGYKNISWFLVLLPYVLMFIGLGMILLSGNAKENFIEGMGKIKIKLKKVIARTTIRRTPTQMMRNVKAQKYIKKEKPIIQTMIVRIN